MEEGDRERAYGYAIRLLTRRDRSETELRGRLTARGFPPAIAEETVSRLRESGYLDDRRYAHRFAESALAAGRCYGSRLRWELSRRGIGEELVAEVAAEASAACDEMETVRRLLERRFPGFDPQTADDRARRRVIGYFMRRGFPLETIRRVMNGE